MAYLWKLDGTQTSEQERHESAEILDKLDTRDVDEARHSHDGVLLNAVVRARRRQELEERGHDGVADRLDLLRLHLPQDDLQRGAQVGLDLDDLVLVVLRVDAGAEREGGAEAVEDDEHRLLDGAVAVLGRVARQVHDRFVC